MPLVSRREWLLVMKMLDETRSEREKLNRGLGDLDKASRKASESAKKSIVDIAKTSKQGVEGLKAVLELGGWLMIAKQVGTALLNITAEARKNSVAFKEAGAALSIMKNTLGQGLTKALEPLAEGFKNILVVGTAVFENFPEVAKATFSFVRDIMKKALSWEGIKGIFLAIGTGVVTVFRSAFEYIPKLFSQVVKLLLNPIYQLGSYIADTLAKAFTLKFDQIISPGTFMKNVMDQQSDQLQAIVEGAKTYIAGQAGAIKTMVTDLGDVFRPETEAFKRTLSQILEPTILALNAKIAGMTGGEGVPVPSTLLIGQQAPLFTPDLSAMMTQADMIATAMGSGSGPLSDSFFEGIRKANEAAAKAAKDAGWANQAKVAFGGTELVQMLSGGGGGILQGLPAIIMKMVSSLSSVMQVMNPITTILQAAMDVLGPIIDNVLAPLIGILKILGATFGQILAPVIQILTPAIQFLASVFVWIYNKIIVPIGNGIIFIFNMIYNCFAGMINGVIWIINAALGWLGVRMDYIALKSLTSGQLSEISTTSVAASGSSSSGSSSSASYAAGTSIRIDAINITAGFIAGDNGLREVALIIRDEIAEAEALGA